MIHPILGLIAAWGGLTGVFALVIWVSFKLAIGIVDFFDPPETPAQIEHRTLAEFLTARYGPELSKADREELNENFPWVG